MGDSKNKAKKEKLPKPFNVDIDPAVRSIIGDSEEAKKAYLDYTIFSQS